MCPVDRTVDRSVAIVHLYTNFSFCAKVLVKSKQGALGRPRRAEHSSTGYRYFVKDSFGPQAEATCQE
jgi:hypothetical protein